MQLARNGVFFFFCSSIVYSHGTHSTSTCSPQRARPPKAIITNTVLIDGRGYPPRAARGNFPHPPSSPIDATLVTLHYKHQCSNSAVAMCLFSAILLPGLFIVLLLRVLLSRLLCFVAASSFPSFSLYFPRHNRLLVLLVLLPSSIAHTALYHVYSLFRKINVLKHRDD